LTTTAGVAPRFLGSTADEGYGRLQVSGGLMTGARSFGLVDLDLSSRFRSRPRESIARLSARWNDQSFPRHTLALGAIGVAGTRVSREFQTVVGGLNGLRAYPVHALAGTQVWRLNAESRWLLVNDYFELVSFGAAAFYDAARAWGPGSAEAGWHHAAGFGLRLALPHSSLNRVARFDVAFPIEPTRDGRREPVFSFGSSQAF
jgi:hemolysin activation/secretion protein